MLTLSNVSGLDYEATNLSRYAPFEPETHLHWGFSIEVVLGQNTRNFQTNWLKSYCASGEVYGGFKGINTILWIFEVVYHAIINILELHGTSKDYGPTYLCLYFPTITLI